jgi:hypothetical protein
MPAGDITQEDMELLAAVTAEAAGIHDPTGWNTPRISHLYDAEWQVRRLHQSAGGPDGRSARGPGNSQAADVSALADMAGFWTPMLGSNGIADISALAAMTDMAGRDFLSRFLHPAHDRSCGLHNHCSTEPREGL